MQAVVVLAVRVSVFKTFFLRKYKGRFSFINSKVIKKIPRFRGIFAVRFGKGSVRFDTNINIKNVRKIAFLLIIPQIYNQNL